MFLCKIPMRRFVQGISLVNRRGAAMQQMASAQSVSPISSYKDGDVGIIKFNCRDAKENVIDVNFMVQFYNCLNDFTQDDSVKGILLMSGKPNSFIAGADTKMIAKCKSVEESTALSLRFQSIMNRVHGNLKPVVASIMGTCLGGGLELALACDYRIGVNHPKTLFGLPEVRLGLLPGGGGTQRLPRLVSLTDGLDMILTGKTVNVAQAKGMGLIDTVIEPVSSALNDDQMFMVNELEKGSVQIVRQLLNAELVPYRASAFPKNLVNYVLDIELFKNLLFAYTLNKVEKATRSHYPAPPMIVNVIRKGYKFGMAEGLKSEAKAFGQLAVSPESKSLIHLFNATTECKKNAYGASKEPVKCVAVVGAGLMGTGIAQVSVQKGLKCFVKDVESSAILRAEKTIADSLTKSLRRKKITPLAKDQAMANLVPITDYAAMSNVDLVIEAVFEDLNIKHQVIKELEKHVSANCVIATNTSAISVAQIAEASQRPENVVGMHYFSPVDKMQLLEIVKAPKTSNESLSKAVEVGLKQGKLCIVVKDSPGFYTTRVLAAVLLETLRLLQEGVHPVELNNLSTKFGFPVGFVTLGDEVGFDVALHILKYLSDRFGQRMTGSGVAPLQKMVDSKMLGRKSGKGAFDYSKKSKTINKAAIDIFKEHGKPTRGCDSDHDRQMRMVSRLVNEALLCLQEGVIASPTQGDVGAVFGIGFPPFLGGPFRFVDNYGADRLVREMDAFRLAYDGAAEFNACDLLRDHAKDPSRRFYVV